MMALAASFNMLIIWARVTIFRSHWERHWGRFVRIRTKAAGFAHCSGNIFKPALGFNILNEEKPFSRGLWMASVVLQNMVAFHHGMCGL